MKLIITGGAGFIGSAVIRHVIANTDWDVLNLDKLTYAGNLESLQTVYKSKRYHFEQVDICDASNLNNVFYEYQPTAVMHLAAESHVDRSIDGPGAFIQTNIVGTYTLLETTLAYWKGLNNDRQKEFRFHHVSTDEVYGDLDETGYFTEDTAYAPSSPYSASKASSDHLVRSWNRTFGLPTIITNCSNNYGPYHFPEKLIPLIILNALEGKDLPVYGNGQQIRDWLYVEDHAEALCKVLSEGVVGHNYNIGGNNEKKNIEVVEAICDLLDKRRPLTPVANNESGVSGARSYRDLIKFVEDRPGHDLRYAIDASKIRDELGWNPRETFDSGIAKTVDWFLQNQNWCQRVQDGTYKRERLGTRKKD